MLLIILAVVICLFSFVSFLDVVIRWTAASRNKYSKPSESACHSCASIDPVSDPAYNMREMAKQSVLLEEHLTVPAKFCPDCCVKHLLHLTGLADEAIALACTRVGDFPLIMESADHFKSCMNDWNERVRHADPINDPQPRQELASKLRDFRKELVVIYFNNSRA